MTRSPSRSALAWAGGVLAVLLSFGLAVAASENAALRAGAVLDVHSDGSVRVEGLFAALDPGDATSAAELARLRAAARALDIETWRDILRVVARDPQRSAPDAELPPLLGSYRVTDAGARFEPRFPPAPGLVVEASFDRDQWNARLGDDLPPGEESAQLQLAAYDAEPSTRVVAVYPASATLPSNLLRLYVQFSAPMGARHVLPHVHLLHDDGTEVGTAFVEVQGGLWDPERTRLTLFVHPGRVKRGVGPNQVLGPVLEEGKTYKLRIDAAARDARGRPLVEPYEQTFTAGPPDRTSPDLTAWTLTPPTSPEAPLRVELKQPADVALLQRLLSVHEDPGNQVPGTFDVAADGSRFEFTPAQPWQPGSYQLRVPPSLEDASGNRVDRLFEEAETDQERPHHAVVRVFEFTVRFAETS